MSCDYELTHLIKTNQSDLSDFHLIHFEELGRSQDLLIGHCASDHHIGMYRNLVDSELGFFCEDCGVVVAVHRDHLTSEQEANLLALEGHKDMVVFIKEMIDEDTRTDKERLIRQIQCLPSSFDTVDILSYLVDRHLEG